MHTCTHTFKERAIPLLQSLTINFWKPDHTIWLRHLKCATWWDFSIAITHFTYKPKYFLKYRALKMTLRYFKCYFICFSYCFLFFDFNSLMCIPTPTIRPINWTIQPTTRKGLKIAIWFSLKISLMINTKSPQKWFFFL